MLTGGEIERALSLWQQTAGRHARLINHSENLTYLVEAQSSRYVLRLHRQDYQSTAAIRSELAWLGALQRDTELIVPQPIPGKNGDLLQHLQTPHSPRVAVLFHHIPGHEPPMGKSLAPLFHTLGQHAATLHRHVETWQKPARFQRPTLTAATILDGSWGDWRDNAGIAADHRPVLDQLADTLSVRLRTYGTSPDRFGLIHADMRLGNLLINNNRVALLDFDDCGLGWFIYDFAAAISFHETHPNIPALKAAWLEGYRKVRPLPASDEAMIDTMIMLRRLALLAWIGSHAETELAQRHAPGFAADTAKLARRYLGQG